MRRSVMRSERDLLITASMLGVALLLIQTLVTILETTARHI